jgi:hypothetical protein
MSQKNKNNPVATFFKLLHLANEIFISFYLLFLGWTKKYDLYFMIYLLVIVVHWILLRNECISSYFEKKALDPTYVLGSRPYHHPFYDSFLSPGFILFLNWMKILTVAIILLRNLEDPSIVLMSIIVMLLQILNYIRKGSMN